LTAPRLSHDTIPAQTPEQVLQPIERLYRSVERTPRAIAIAGGGDGDRDLSYAELGALTDALAAAFEALDPPPGGRVAICAANTTEHLLAMLATYAAGKVWVPLNPRNGRTELDAMVAVTRPTLVIADAANAARFSECGATLVLTESLRALAAGWLGRAPARIARDPEDPQIIKFSGGSTGVPKPVVQSRRCVNVQADGLRDFFEFTRDDVNLIAAPLTHGASCFVLPILEVGGCHVLIPVPKPPAMLDAIMRHGVTTIYAPPTLLYSLIDHPETATAELRSLRHVIYSAAPMPPPRIRDCQRVLGPVIETAYGQVEAPQIIAAMRAAELLDEQNQAAVGRPSPVVRLRISAPDGATLPAGEIGEIEVAGPLLMTGYLDRPEDTALAMSDGWLRTGDLGSVDGRGYLFIRGRLREVINTGGFKVFPGDVEASLARHSAVAECAVFGLPDARWGEAVSAAVVTWPKCHVTAEELMAWVKDEIGSVKAPKRVHFVQQLDRNAAGKVSRAAVAARVASECRASGNSPHGETND